MAKLAFLGLGVMGYPMAGHLLKKGGHEVTVFNRTAAKAQQWAKEYGGKHAPTPREAAKDCELVMMCVGNDDDVRSVVYGDNGVLAGMKKARSSSITPPLPQRWRARSMRRRRREALASSTPPCPAARPVRSTGVSRHHVRRRAGGLRLGEAGARCLRQDAR